MKSKLFLLFLIFAIIFVGCSKEDCSLKDTTYQKYSYDETKKTCIALTPIKQNVCGNGVIEKDETYCNCAKDGIAQNHPTLGCNGTLGNYIQKTCNLDKLCVNKQNNLVVMQTKYIKFRGGFFEFDANIKLNLPYVLHTQDENKVNIEDFRLFQLINNNPNIVIKDITVEEMKIEDSNSILLTKANYGILVDSTNSQLPNKVVSFGDVDKYKKMDQIRAKLMVSYIMETYDYQGKLVKGPELKREELVENLGQWVIINPNLYDPVKDKNT